MFSIHRDKCLETDGYNSDFYTVMIFLMNVVVG